MNQIQETDSKPWYKQFWPWFLIALPASSVIAGITTVIIAVNNADDMVKKDYYKQGLAINQVLEKRQLAQQMGIRAEVALDAERIQVALSSKTPINDSLFLDFRHATLADKDFSLALKQNAHGIYFAELEQPAQGKWHITLRPHSHQWEIEQIWTLPTKRPLILGQ